ncbi:MAG: sensor histidine kinase [Janthinobacterium lividum]
MIGRSFILTMLFTLVQKLIFAQSPINFNGNLKVIGNNIEILIDSNSDIDLSKAKQSLLYTKSKSSFPNLGTTPYSYWIRFKIKNNTSKETLGIQITQSIIDFVDYYQINNNKIIKVNFSGHRRPFYNRLVAHHTFIYPIDISQGKNSTVYLHLKSGKQLVVPIYLGTIEQIIERAFINDFYFGVYIGIILVMLLYNLFIYYTVNDKSYLYYVTYLAIVLISQASMQGYFFRFVLPYDPEFADNLIYVSADLIGIAAIEFSKIFLLSKRFTPILHKISYVFWLIYSISIILAFLKYYNASYIIMLISAMISAIYVLFMAVIILLKGYRPAKFFLISWSGFIFCVIIYVLKDFDILFPYNNITSSALLIGSAFEAILLSFALADKINIYKKEKEQSQAQALFTSEENRRIISEQNVTLERNVKERTNELLITNKNLNKTLTDLKEAQMQLVEAEKMASLGQLTAGIAHEINNPINFVTSNVAPLRRDVDILVDAITNIESVGLSDATIEEKQQQIDDYKEEIDLDYLKMEIGHLLNGIHEGATRTADIVKGLKIFSRLDEDDLKKADINEGLNSTLIIANNLIGNKIQVIKSLGNIPTIECYPGKLNQVFLNIISNAVFAIQEKFNNQPGGILKITTTNDDQHLTITIEDNGTGMSEATKKKIFEPFFTTKNVGVGTGLGMSIVYNTIKKHNAEIYLNSTEGVGTEFIIQLNLVFEEPIAEYQSEQQG